MNIDIRVSQDRIKKFVSLDEMIAMQNNDLVILKNVMARFMFNKVENDYYPVDVVETDDDIVINPSPIALQILGKVTIEKLEDAGKKFKENVVNASVSPTSAET